MQIVLDTNVFISFLLTRGETISRILDAWEDEEFVVLVSSQILAEIRRVLEYAHLKTRIKPDEAKTLLDTLETDARFVKGTLLAVGATTDPSLSFLSACAPAPTTIPNPTVTSVPTSIATSLPANTPPMTPFCIDGSRMRRRVKNNCGCCKDD